MVELNATPPRDEVDDALEMLLRDAEQIVAGLEGVQQLVIAVTLRERGEHDER